MSPADDRKLVQVVECHHVLWDNRMKEFRDKRLTQHGWKSVAELLDREVDDVMYRWSNLRRQYSRRITRLRQKSGNETPEKPWHLMPLLTFLKPCITPRKRKHSSNHNDSSTSTEEIFISSQSDFSRESSPLVVRINPVDPPRNSLFYSTPEKKPLPQTDGLPRRPFRKPSSKAKNFQVFNLPSEKETTSELSCNQTIEEQIYNSSLVSSPKVQKLEPIVHKLLSTSKAPQTAIRSLPLKAKKLKTSSEKTLSLFAKTCNASSETEKKTKLLKEKTSVTKCTNMSMETEKKRKISAVKTVPSVVKNTDALLETEKKLKTFAQNTLSVAKSTNESSEVLGHRGYDSDEHFLLSLASDFRKMDPRQKFECKLKMISMVCEQYIKN